MLSLECEDSRMRIEVCDKFMCKLYEYYSEYGMQINTSIKRAYKIVWKFGVFVAFLQGEKSTVHLYQMTNFFVACNKPKHLVCMLDSDYWFGIFIFFFFSSISTTNYTYNFLHKRFANRCIDCVCVWRRICNGYIEQTMVHRFRDKWIFKLNSVCSSNYIHTIPLDLLVLGCMHRTEFA